MNWLLQLRLDMQVTADQMTNAKASPSAAIFAAMFAVRFAAIFAATLAVRLAATFAATLADKHFLIRCQAPPDQMTSDA
eukprot:350143-Chlamydomonas_euryale.AAC.6